jgi:hypothetical protein
MRGAKCALSAGIGLSCYTARVPAEDVKPDRGGGLSFAVVGGVFAVLLALGVSLGVYIHGRYVAAERVVARHLPPDAALVVRWDVEKVTTFEPTRRFLLPLVDSARPSSRTGSASGDGRTERLRKTTGLSLGRDLRELAVVVGPGGDDWAVVAGGSFPKGSVVAASERLLADEGWRWTTNGKSGLVAPEGVALGQATDGALVMASSPELLARCLPATANEPIVPRTGAGTLVARLDRPGVAPSVRAFVAPLGDVAELRVEAEWGSPLPVTVTFRYAREVPADVRLRFRKMLVSLLGDRLSEIERAGGPIDVQPAGNLTVRARLRLDDTALESAADQARAFALGRIRARFGSN